MELRGRFREDLETAKNSVPSGHVARFGGREVWSVLWIWLKNQKPLENRNVADIMNINTRSSSVPAAEGG